MRRLTGNRLYPIIIVTRLFLHFNMTNTRRENTDNYDNTDYLKRQYDASSGKSTANYNIQNHRNNINTTSIGAVVYRDVWSSLLKFNRRPNVHGSNLTTYFYLFEHNIRFNRVSSRINRTKVFLNNGLRVIAIRDLHDDTKMGHILLSVTRGEQASMGKGTKLTLHELNIRNNFNKLFHHNLFCHRGLVSSIYYAINDFR